MKSVSTHEAKTHLSRLIAEVEKGEEVIICRGSVPAARLVPLDHVHGVPGVPPRKRPRVGVHTSDPVRYQADAFDPLGPEELAEWGLD